MVLSTVLEVALGGLDLPSVGMSSATVPSNKTVYEQYISESIIMCSMLFAFFVAGYTWPGSNVPTGKDILMGNAGPLRFKIGSV